MDFLANIEGLHNLRDSLKGGQPEIHFTLKPEGNNVHSSLHSAWVGRFQAIFLTTVTTVMGLTPLMLETSEQAQYLIPAAISLAFGEIFATLITLILIPVIIAIVEDVKNYLKS